MKVARFPAHCELAGFDFIQSQVNEELVAALHHCEFMEEAQSIVFVGPGTGETLLATTISVQTFSTIINLFAFYQLLSWLTLLEQEKQPGKQGPMANRLMHADLVTLGELGYLLLPVK